MKAKYRHPFVYFVVWIQNLHCELDEWIKATLHPETESTCGCSCPSDDSSTIVG